jgi:hypothetical protein
MSSAETPTHARCAGLHEAAGRPGTSSLPPLLTTRERLRPTLALLLAGRRRK